jgi:glycosyltransferase involved in cell wall biosynthesis
MKLFRRKTRLYIDASPIVSDHFSGVGHSLLGLIKALDNYAAQDKRLAVTLFAPQDQEDRLRQFGFKRFSLKALPIGSKEAALLQQQGNLPELDVILGKGVYFFPNFLDWPLKSSKSILLVHDISFELYPEFVHPPNQKFLSTHVPISIRRSNAVATVSPKAQTEIESQYGLPKDSVLVIPNAVDSESFYKRDSKEVEQIKKTYGLDGDYFIFVGNIEPRKNIERLVKAYRRLPKNITDKVSLLLVGGGGWNDDQIKRVIKQSVKDGYNIIRPAKFVPDEHLPALYSGAKALVYVPIYEGFGMPPLEAMACQTPVISSNASSLPWVTGQAALVVDPVDEAAISRAMREVLTTATRDALIKRGKKQLAKFSWDNSAQILVQAAKKL